MEYQATAIYLQGKSKNLQGEPLCVMGIQKQLKAEDKTVNWEKHSRTLVLILSIDTWID